MSQLVDLQSWPRRELFEFFSGMSNPFYSVTFRLDVTRLVRLSRRGDLKFNMLLCWCAGRTASRVEEFYTLPVGDRLIRYDALAVDTVVALRDGASLPVTFPCPRISPNSGGTT